MISYDERVKTYTDAYSAYGERNQLIVAIEELSEVQKEICKVLRGDGDMDHLAEEVADATIMLEQVRLMFGLNDIVCTKMDEKVDRLLRRLTQAVPNISKETTAALERLDANAHGIIADC